jgi:ubiquinone/menaquinone biosynthesis C-methylase UbiE
MKQKWKTDPSLYNCPTKKVNNQIKKELDYKTTYVREFLDADPIRDWESIDRCKKLWDWTLKKLNMDYTKLSYSEWQTWKVLDCGTKDGQFPEWLNEIGCDQSIGIEISKPYVNYAKSKKRPVIWGNVCDIDFEDNSFDVVFSHHLLGLTPDYYKALSEMYRVTRKYMVTLNDVPGNPRKHYSYISSPNIYYKFIEEFKPEVIFNDYWRKDKEWVMLIKK